MVDGLQCSNVYPQPEKDGRPVATLTLCPDPFRTHFTVSLPVPLPALALAVFPITSTCVSPLFFRELPLGYWLRLAP